MEASPPASRSCARTPQLISHDPLSTPPPMDGILLDSFLGTFFESPSRVRTSLQRSLPRTKLDSHVYKSKALASLPLLQHQPSPNTASQ